jgi:hypothetical protein
LERRTNDEPLGEPDKERNRLISKLRSPGERGNGTILLNLLQQLFENVFRNYKIIHRFHNRLVTTHNLMFGNYITSKIKNEDLREKTLSEVAVNLAKTNRIQNEEKE